MEGYNYLKLIIPLIFILLFLIGKSKLRQLISITIKIGDIFKFLRPLPVEYRVSFVNVELIAIFVIIIILIFCNHLFSNIREIGKFIILPMFIAMIINIIIAEKFIRKKEGK
jgi:Sec-independent protein translocase protein TatA